jgi:hypothetical protein
MIPQKDVLAAITMLRAHVIRRGEEQRAKAATSKKGSWIEGRRIGQAMVYGEVDKLLEAIEEAARE